MNIAQGPDQEQAVANTDYLAMAAIKFVKENGFFEMMHDRDKIEFVIAHMIVAAKNLQAASISHGLHQIAESINNK